MLKRIFGLNSNTNHTLENQFRYVPNEILFEILCYLAITDVIHVSQTDKRFNSLINNQPANNIVICSDTESLKHAIKNSPEFYSILYQLDDETSRNVNRRSDLEKDIKNSPVRALFSFGISKLINYAFNNFLQNTNNANNSNNKNEKDLEQGTTTRLQINKGTYAQVILAERNRHNYSLLLNEIDVVNQKQPRIRNNYKLFTRLSIVSACIAAVDLTGSFISSMVVDINCPTVTSYSNSTYFNLTNNQYYTQQISYQHNVCPDSTLNNVYAPLLGTTLPLGAAAIGLSIYFCCKAGDSNVKYAGQTQRIQNERDALTNKMDDFKKKIKLFLIPNMQNRSIAFDENEIDTLVQDKGKLLTINTGKM